MESIFLFKSYKTYLRAVTQDKNQRGLLTKLAKAARCELSYLSRVLSGDIHITPDHAFRMTDELSLSSLERDYFLTLVEFERAGDANYRSFLSHKIKSLLQQSEDLSQKTSKPLTEVNQAELLYHSNWVYCAIHLLVSIPEFQTVEALSQKINTPPVLIQGYLEQLLAMGYVQKISKNRWDYLNGATHTPKTSPLVTLHHMNWRNRAITDAQNFMNESLHYTGVQSMSRASYEKIKQLLLSAIADLEKEAGPSACEELVNVNIDVYKL